MPKAPCAVCVADRARKRSTRLERDEHRITVVDGPLGPDVYVYDARATCFMCYVALCVPHSATVMHMNQARVPSAITACHTCAEMNARAEYERDTVKAHMRTVCAVVATAASIVFTLVVSLTV